MCMEVLVACVLGVAAGTVEFVSARTAAAAATTVAMTAITVSLATLRWRWRFSLAEVSSALVLRTSRRSFQAWRPAGRR